MRRFDNRATPSDLVDGPLYTFLVTGGPMPTVFKSAFERGILGNPTSDGLTRAYTVADPVAVELVIEQLNGQPQKVSTDPTVILKRQEVMRDTIAAYRKANPTVSPVDADHQRVLDMALYDHAVSKRPKPVEPK